MSDLLARGTRHVGLPGPVIISHKDRESERQAVRGLTHVRELTGYGISVDWDLDLSTEIGQWWRFSHLYPPRSVSGPDGDAVLDQWRTTFHMNKCGYRRGKGFVEIIDMRHGTQRIVIPNVPEEKFASLLDGALFSDFREQGTKALMKFGLVHQIGTLLWWLPSHIPRWPVVGQWPNI